MNAPVFVTYYIVYPQSFNYKGRTVWQYGVSEYTSTIEQSQRQAAYYADYYSRVYGASNVAIEM